MSIVKTSTKGQVVIPRDVRRKLGIKPGQKVSIKAVGDKAEIIPLPEDPITSLRGILRSYHGSLAKELVEERRKDDRAR